KQTAIFSPVLLLDLKLISLPFQQFGDQSPISFSEILMSDLENWNPLEFTFCVTQHSLVGLVGRQNTTVEVGYGNADGGILKNGSPTERLRSLSQCVFREGIGGRRSANWTNVPHIAGGIDSECGRSLFHAA